STTRRGLGALRMRKPGASLSSVRARSSGLQDLSDKCAERVSHKKAGGTAVPAHCRLPAPVEVRAEFPARATMPRLLRCRVRFCRGAGVLGCAWSRRVLEGKRTRSFFTDLWMVSYIQPAVLFVPCDGADQNQEGSRVRGLHIPKS